MFQAKPKQQRSHFTFQESETKHEVATTESPGTEACTPRSTLIIRNHRPSDLSLTKTNGLTTVSLAELKQRICDAGTNSYATLLQVPRPKANHLPKTPETPSPLIVMGNRPSSIAGSPVPDNASLHSVVRKHNRVSRKSSTNLLRRSSNNLLKRVESQAPLPAKLTGAVIHVQQQVSPISSDDARYDSDESAPELDTKQNYSSEEWQDVVQQHSASPVTITNENAFQSREEPDLSESENQPDFKAAERSPQRQSKPISALPQAQATARHLPLSSSIPAPSPLPEDSPHKYGLKDRSDTPDMPELEEITVVKARRRSSGLDIFNVSSLRLVRIQNCLMLPQEAKSLQSASSFLNGLSTSRRRAESATRLTNGNIASQEPDHPYSSCQQSRPRSSRPAAPQSTYSSERRRGHNFKPSGFAYSRPLKMAQIKCYRDHERLLPSRNQKAAVECAVCHVDDDKEHFSCSWCAIRMCRFCRKDFSEKGMMALRERMKQAELGTEESDSSLESLEGGMRGVRKGYA